MYRNIQPFGGDHEFTRGRLRLVRSLFGCGFILTGTHPSISVCENSLTAHAKTLVNCAVVEKGDSLERIPTVSCNRTLVSLRVPEFFDAEDLGVAPAKACKRCRGCQDCSFRNTMMSREKELVVQQMEDQLQFDEENSRVTVAYLWTDSVYKLSDNFQQATRMQTSVERRLLKDQKLMDVYNVEF